MHINPLQIKNHHGVIFFHIQYYVCRCLSWLTHFHGVLTLNIQIQLSFLSNLYYYVVLGLNHGGVQPISENRPVRRIICNLLICSYNKIITKKRNKNISIYLSIYIYMKISYKIIKFSLLLLFKFVLHCFFCITSAAFSFKMNYS